MLAKLTNGCYLRILFRIWYVICWLNKEKQIIFSIYKTYNINNKAIII